MGKIMDVVQGIIACHKEFGTFKPKQIADFLDEPIGITTISSYVSYLGSAGLLEKVTTEKGGFHGYKIPDIEKLIQESSKGLNHVKKMGLAVKGMGEFPESNKPRRKRNNNNGDQRDISKFADQINSLDWTLNTYIPELEEKVRKLESENKDLYRQLQNFFGIAKQAKIIHSGKCK